MTTSAPATIFTEIARRIGTINFVEFFLDTDGFPDTDGPQQTVDAAYAALGDGHSQYPPLAGPGTARRFRPSGSGGTASATTRATMSSSPSGPPSQSPLPCSGCAMAMTRS